MFPFRVSRSMKLISSALIVGGGAFFGFAISTATTIHSGNKVRIADTGMVPDDIVTTGGSVRIMGPVDGDALALCNDFSLTGEISGALAVFAGSVDLRGPVRHSVGAFTGHASFESEVSGSAYAFAERVDVSREAVFVRDLRVFAGRLNMDGVIAGDLKGKVGKAFIAGRVDGDVSLETGELEIQKGAVINGNVRYVSKLEAVVDVDAAINGRLTRIDPETLDDNGASFLGGAFFEVWAFFGALIIGIALVLVSRKSFTRVTQQIMGRPAIALGYGLVVFGGGAVISLLLLITVVGIPAAFLTMTGLATMFFVGKIFVGAGIGALIFGRVIPEKLGGILGRLFVGLALFAILCEVPYLGWIVYLLAAVLGAGAITLALRNGDTGAAAGGTGGADANMVSRTPSL